MTPAMQMIQDVEARLRERGVSVARVCQEARLDRVTWHRWKRGEAQPRAETWGNVRGVLVPLIGDVPESVPPRPVVDQP